MILKHFKKYSNKYREHLIELQKTLSEKDSEAIGIALYNISRLIELNRLLSEQCKKLEIDIYNLHKSN